MRLTNATIKLFERFSYGELKLFEESEIDQNMEYDLSWNNGNKIANRSSREATRDHYPSRTSTKPSS